MNNKNDNLKEKEIKREAPLKENELENVSGGFWSPLGHYYIDTKICESSKCKAAGCKVKCCHPTAIDVEEKFRNIRFEKNDFYKEVYYSAKINGSCQHCLNCDAAVGCVHEAIKRSIL